MAETAAAVGKQGGYDVASSTLLIDVDRWKYVPNVCAFSGDRAEVRVRYKLKRTKAVIPLPFVIVQRLQVVTVPVPLTRRARLYGRTLPMWAALAIVALPLGAVVLAARLAPMQTLADGTSRFTSTGQVMIGVGLALAAVAAVIVIRAQMRIALVNKGRTIRVRRAHPEFRAAYEAAVSAPPVLSHLPALMAAPSRPAVVSPALAASAAALVSSPAGGTAPGYRPFGPGR